MSFKVSKKAVLIFLSLGIFLCLLVLAGCTRTKAPLYRQIEVPTVKAYPATVNQAPNYVYRVPPKFTNQ